MNLKVAKIESTPIPLAVAIYSKEELFCIIQLGKHLNIKVDINPHKFPILEIMAGTKEVFATFNQDDGLSILVLDSGVTKDILKRKNLYTVSVMEFFSYMGENFDSFTHRVYQSRKSTHNSTELINYITINGIQYPTHLIEEIIEIPVDDFLLNLDYEMTIIEKNYDNENPQAMV